MSENSPMIKFKIAAAAMLTFGKLLPIHIYLTNPHRIWWKRCKFDVKRILHVGKYKSKMAAEIMKQISQLIHMTRTKCQRLCHVLGVRHHVDTKEKTVGRLSMP